MVVHNPVADSFVVAHILVEDSLAVGHNLAVVHNLAAGSLAVVRNPAADNSARDSLVVVDSPAVAAHTPAVLCSVADIAAFRLAADSFAAARNLVADNFVAAADSSFGFVQVAAVLLPVVLNTCKTALRPATAGNNVYNA